MDSLPFEEWHELYNEVTDQILRDNWRKEAPDITLEEYKETLKAISQVGGRKEYERLKRLSNL